MSRFFAKVFWVAVLGLGLALAAFPQDKSDPGTVKIDWEEFKKLLNLGSDEIVLSWTEFQRIIAQTGTTFVPAFELRDERVVLTRAQFRALLEKMKSPVTATTYRPAEFLFRRTAYRARVAGGAVLVRAEIAVETFPAPAGAYVRIPLFPASIALRDVWLNDVPALVETADGRYTVTTNRSGPLRITADFSLRAPVEQAQGIACPIVRSPITTFEIDLPYGPLDVDIPGAQQVELTERGGTTRVSAVLTPAESFSLRWRKKIPEAVSGPAKVYADTVTLISVEDDALRVNAEFVLSILQNSIATVVLRVPDGYSILDVRGNGVGDWREIPRRDASYLEIPFDFPKKGNVTLAVAAEKLLPSGGATAEYAGFALVDAVREKGFLGVELKGSSEVSLASVQGADALDVSELPATLIGRSLKPLLFGFKYLRPPFALALEVKKHEAVPVVSTVIDLASGVTLFTADGKLVHRVVYAVRNTSKQFLEVALPKGAELWSVFVAGEPAKPRWGDGRVLVPLNRSREGASGLAAFEVELIYYEKTARFGAFGRRGTRFPVPDVIVSQALWSVYLPEGFEYLHFGGSVEKERLASGLRPLLSRKRRSAAPALSGQANVGDVVATHALKDKILREADEMKKEFSANLGLAKDQLASQAENEVRFSQRVEDAQAGNITVATGILPLRVQIPTSGELYRFARTLLSGEEMALNLTFMAVGFKTGAVAVIVAILGLAAVLVLRTGRGGKGGRPGRDAAVKMAVILFAGALALLAFSKVLAVVCAAGAVAAFIMSKASGWRKGVRPLV
jgi:hypothetical protein